MRCIYRDVDWAVAVFFKNLWFGGDYVIFEGRGGTNVFKNLPINSSFSLRNRAF